MKNIVLFFAAIVICFGAMGQVPGAFNYQAAVRNPSGEIISNKAVSFRISILTGSENGSPVYSELHHVTTNDYGLANLKIGMGENKAGIFSPGGWGVEDLYIKIEIDVNGGATFANIGTSQLLSVPYALHSQTVAEDNVEDDDADPENEIQDLQLAGMQLSLTKSEVSVTLPSTGGGDNWGTDVVVSDESLEGQGTSANPLKIAKQGAVAGNVLKWDGSAWIPDDENNPDNDPTNEIQELSFSGAQLSLNKNGGSVDLSSLGGGGLSLPFTARATSVDNLIDITNDGDGHAIHGIASSGGGIGVFGESNAISGTGVSGYNFQSSGVTFGVRGEVVSTDGYSGFFKGGKFHVGGNAGFGTENPTTQLEVAGQIKITGGSPGNGKVLTSDASGLASWQTPSEGGGLTLPYDVDISASQYAFEITNSEGSAINGNASAVSGYTAGVEGTSRSAVGTGVIGRAWSSTGGGSGVFGESRGPNGTGVVGISTSASGTTIGIRGKVESGSGFSGHFMGGKFHVSGNAGFGTENPTTQLEVAGQVKITGGSPGNGKVLTSDASGLASWETPSSSSIWSTSGPNIYYNSGNVGIGTSSPGDKLEVNGNITLSGSSDRFIAFPNPALSLFIGGKKNVPAAYAVHIVTNESGSGGQPRLTIVSDKVGIGTTSPSQKLDVNGNVRVRTIGSGPSVGAVNRTSDGTLTTSTSDIRLKENISPLKGSLDKIMKIRGVSFTWKDNPEYGKRIGFIAQEFEEVIPELVFTNPADGYKGINYAEITAVLVEAVKELKIENDNLKSQNRQIIDRLEKLERIVITANKSE